MSGKQSYLQALVQFELECCRGWGASDYPASLEPCFVDLGELRKATQGYDDGLRPSLGSQLREWIHGSQNTASVETPKIPDFQPIPDVDIPQWWSRRLLVPTGTSIQASNISAWLWSLVSCRKLGFELLGHGGRVSVNVTAPVNDARVVEGSLATHFPKVVPTPSTDLSKLIADHATNLRFLELGLIRESIIELASVPLSPDPLAGLLLALAQTRPGELSLVQILFTPIGRHWNGALMAFGGRKKERSKLESPLFAVAIRLCASGGTPERSDELLIRMMSSFAVYSTPQSNGFVPLSTNESVELEDIASRVTRRSGMIISFPELVSLVHLPNADVHLPALIREERRSHQAPASMDTGIRLGENRHAGVVREVFLPDEARLKHVHLVGASGTGKSTLLVSMILEDIQQGNGVACIDPHGDLVDEILARIPEERHNDVIVFDPVAEGHIVGWNLLKASSELEKRVLESDLVSIFRRLSTSWGDQMEAVFSNAVVALLDCREDMTILELRRFLVDEDFRSRILGQVSDHHVKQYWSVEYPLIAKRNPQAPILTRLDMLLRSRLVRESISEKTKPLDFREILDSGKILLARLSLGALGETSASLLGSLLASKIHQVALSRQEVGQGQRRPFFLYIDEFQHVATPSMATIFSGTRKYGLGMVVAHQSLYQLHKAMPEVERSVLANAYTRIVFRSGDEDARKLESGFSHFSASDVMELETGQAVVRFGEKGKDFNLETSLLPRIDPVEADERRARIREFSFKRYGRQRGQHQEEERSTVEPVVASPEVQVAHAPKPEDKSPNENPPKPSLPGRGGPEHRYLQQFVKEHAQNLGFKVDIEHKLNSGGWVDVALERGEQRIAIEVATSSSAKQELEHITEALEAGFGSVVVVTRKKRLLKSLNSELKRLGLAEQAFALSPEESLAFLDGQMPELKKDETIAGYTVNVRYSKGDPASDARRKQALAMILANRMKEQG